MNAVEFLKDEHRKAKAKFQEIERAAPERRAALWTPFQVELDVHEHVEDEFLYGPLSAEPKAKGTPLADFQERQDKDVAQLEMKMAELNALDPASDKWLTVLVEIRTALEGHIRVEEMEILPLIPSVWDAAKLEQAGRGMEEEKTRKTESAKPA